MADPFDTLGVPATFPVDGLAVERAWLLLNATHHPDRSADRDAAAEKTARINDAKRVLSEPEQAARALLDRLGGPSASDVKDLPDGMLLSVLEIRERMDDALASDDSEQRRELCEWGLKERAGFIERVASLFSQADDVAPDAGLLRRIRLELNGWRYIERMLEQIDPETSGRERLR